MALTATALLFSMLCPKPIKRLTFVNVTGCTLTQNLTSIDLEIPNSNYTVCLTLHPIILNIITLFPQLINPNQFKNCWGGNSGSLVMVVDEWIKKDIFDLDWGSVKF